MLTVVVGMQWGDEGKGKVVSGIHHTVSVRMNGGPNAGHTVGGIPVHQVPPGFIFPSTHLLIAAGSVVDPFKLRQEILRLLHDYSIDVRHRLFIDPRAHIITPDHLARDASEEHDRIGKIGTTLTGNGPVHADKYARRGQQIGSLPRDDERVRDLNLDDVREQVLDALDFGGHVLLLVAHGTMLDIDHGTYPFVTSSHCTAAGGLAAVGLPPSFMRHGHSRMIGVVKAYTTRVAPGPMRGEMKDADAHTIRELGHEYGTTTQRPRRLGWLDLGQLEYAAQINGPDFLVLTKTDVLADRDKVSFVASSWNDEAEPIIKFVKGWSSTAIRQTGDLPAGLLWLIGRIEERTRARVSQVGVGPGANDVIRLATVP